MQPTTGADMATTAEINAQLHAIYYREAPAPEAPYCCARCGSTFKTSDDRREHLKEHVKKAEAR